MATSYKDYPNFYSNDFIKEIGAKPKWTISDKDKRPINIQDLKIKLEDPRAELHGANQYNPQDMTTLDDLIHTLPNAANHAFLLNAQKDGFVVLDIEARCPDDLKKEFLKLPYIYGEHSLSGKGIHLICPLPKNFKDFPDYQNMVKLQEKHKWYEILMNHWVTFTRNSLDPIMSYGDGKHDLADVYAYLAKSSRATKPVTVSQLVKRPDMPSEKRIINLLKPYKYHKTLSDFYNDSSRYEFGYAGFLYYHAREIMKNYPSLKKLNYNDTQYAWLLYDLLKARLPHREKHDVIRDGMPWLLFTAVLMVAKSQQDKDKDKKEEEN